nr:pre-mRNA-splicing factor 18 isoform X2 [Onthophagus taurus]
MVDKVVNITSTIVLECFKEMDILKAEIAKKRKLLEEKQLIDSNKKCFKRGDLLAKENEKYQDKYGTAPKEELTTKKKRPEENSYENTPDHIPPRHEVISKLRDRGEPILLFGESQIDSFKRLRHCEILEPEVNRGFRNDFQEAMEKVDQAYLDELLISSEGKNERNKDSNVDQEQEANYEDIQEMARKMGCGNRDHDMTVITKFIEFMLKMWQDQLQNRPPEEKMGTKGKLAGAIYAQTKVYLKPLLKKLKTFTLPEDISDSLTEIVEHLLHRNYLKASDAYLQMAIGNAPWPIGVTMVGIHARTGREKIFSKNVAHVMNDETQRKYIQALKRLMTKCQEYFPTDPSRCVEYNAFNGPQVPGKSS